MLFNRFDSFASHLEVAGFSGIFNPKSNIKIDGTRVKFRIVKTIKSLSITPSKFLIALSTTSSTFSRSSA
jgi:hypothetical protein